MWWTITIVALAADPALPTEAETGTVVMVVTWQNEDSWARAVWERTARRMQRRWRRAERKSDTPLPAPEPPPLASTPATGTRVVFRSAPQISWVQTVEVDPEGRVSVQLPPGTWDLEIEHQEAVPQWLYGLSVRAGETVRIEVTLEEFEETYIITHRGAPWGASSCSHC